MQDIYIFVKNSPTLIYILLYNRYHHFYFFLLPDTTLDVYLLRGIGVTRPSLKSYLLHSTTPMPSQYSCGLWWNGTLWATSHVQVITSIITSVAFLSLWTCFYFSPDVNTELSLLLIFSVYITASWFILLKIDYINIQMQKF